MSERPTVVFGLDGAHFELIEPWLEAGDLPNLKRAIETGVTGDLQSVLPPVTSPNWKAYATGKNPGKIGIFWWENVDVENRRVYYPAERKHGNTEYWELLAAEESVGVVNVPTTYPPKDLDGDGVLIAGAPDGQDDGYTHPPELESALESEFDYRVLKRARIAENSEKAAEEILELIDLRFTVARHFFKERDLSFLQVTTFYLNSLHHFLWDDEYTRQAWQLIDDHLGVFLDEGYDVVLMSDHGSNAIETVFHVNTWLEREDYLKVEAGVPDTLHRFGITTDRLLSAANMLGVRSIATRLAPRWLLNYIPSDSGEVKREGKTANVDWDESEALASGQGPIYITLDEDHPRYESVRDELISKLEALTTPDGSPIADAVHRGEDVYDGAFLDEAPDLVIEQRPNVHIVGNVGREDVFTTPGEDDWRAENKRDGLFVATGPSFTTGTVEEISILDLAPTLLHLRSQAIPSDIDGEVREEVFAPESDPAERPTEYRQTDTRAAERERIRRVARRADL
jgi:predicted AlkP superfamily phosphohydrolase/phosphomutase